MEYEYNYGEPEFSEGRQFIENMLFPYRGLQYTAIKGRLNNFYKQNGIDDIATKDNMRHMGASALMASRNWLGGRKTAKHWGNAKEGYDIMLNKNDVEHDLINNQIGRNIGMKNKNKNTDEILQEVYNEVLNRYNSNQ